MTQLSRISLAFVTTALVTVPVGLNYYQGHGVKTSYVTAFADGGNSERSPGSAHQDGLQRAKKEAVSRKNKLEKKREQAAEDVEDAYQKQQELEKKLKKHDEKNLGDMSEQERQEWVDRKNELKKKIKEADEQREKAAGREQALDYRIQAQEAAINDIKERIKDVQPKNEPDKKQERSDADTSQKDGSDTSPEKTGRTETDETTEKTGDEAKAGDKQYDKQLKKMSKSELKREIKNQAGMVRKQKNELERWKESLDTGYDANLADDAEEWISDAVELADDIFKWVGEGSPPLTDQTFNQLDRLINKFKKKKADVPGVEKRQRNIRDALERLQKARRELERRRGDNIQKSVRGSQPSSGQLEPSAEVLGEMATRFERNGNRRVTRPDSHQRRQDPGEAAAARADDVAKDLVDSAEPNRKGTYQQSKQEQNQPISGDARGNPKDDQTQPYPAGTYLVREDGCNWSETIVLTGAGLMRVAQQDPAAAEMSLRVGDKTIRLERTGEKSASGTWPGTNAIINVKGSKPRTIKIFAKGSDWRCTSTYRKR